MQNFAISGQNIRLPFIFVSSGDGQTPIQNITQATSNLIVEYHPPSGAIFLTKTVDANNLRNLGRGVYDIIFSGTTELTSTGLFQYYGIVSGTTAPFYGQIQIVESGATAIAAQIITNTIKLNQILSSGNALETSVQSVQTAVNQILSSGNALQSTLVTVSGNLSTAQTSLNQILSSGNALQSTLVTVSGILTTVSGDVATKASQTSINSILSSGHSLPSGHLNIIADAVLDEVINGHLSENSLGSGIYRLLSSGQTASLSQADKDAISSGVWDQLTTNYSAANTFGSGFKSLLSTGTASQTSVNTLQTSVNSLLSSGHSLDSGNVAIIVDATWNELLNESRLSGSYGSGVRNLLTTGTASQISVDSVQTSVNQILSSGIAKESTLITVSGNIDTKSSQTSVNSILSSGHAMRSGDIDIIADKVLDEQISQHLGTGTLGSGIYRLLGSGATLSLTASDIGSIATGVWNTPQSTFTTVGVFGNYLDAKVSDAASAAGANSVGILTKFNDGSAAPGVKITVKNSAQSATLGVKYSDANGSGSFSLDNGTYKIILQRYDMLHTVPETLTVAGTTYASYTGSLFSIDTPSSVSGCNVFGWIIDGTGLAVTGKIVTAKYISPDTLSAFAIVSSPLTVLTNVSGLFQIQLLRNSKVKIKVDDANLDSYERIITVPDTTSGNWVNL